MTQFLLTFFTALLLSLFGINFQYDLFGITFLSESSLDTFSLVLPQGEGPKWSEEMIWFIYGSGPVIITALGMFLRFAIDRIDPEGWKVRLALTWLAFMMTCALPCGIIAGVFF